MIGKSFDESDDHLAGNIDLADTLALKSTNWKDIYEFLKLPARVGKVQRTTKETDIYIQLNLDGTGVCKNDTGLGFFDTC